MAETPSAVINPQLSKSVAELVAYAKDNWQTRPLIADRHIAAPECRAVQVGQQQNILHVPYKGGGPSLMAVVAGEVQMTSIR